MSKEKEIFVSDITEVGISDEASEDFGQVNINAVTSQAISLEAVGGSSLTIEQKLIILKRLNHEGLENLDDLPLGTSLMIEKIESLTDQAACEILEVALDEFKGDVNFPEDAYSLIEELVGQKNGIKFSSIDQKLESGIHQKNPLTPEKEHDFLESKFNYFQIFDWSLQVRIEAALIAYHSPYPEVRAVADCYDDPTIPVETIRVYILGLIWTGVHSFVNQFFSNRQPAISLSSSVIQMLLYPSGMFLAKVLPAWRFKILGLVVDLNPGPWNRKEQLLATLFCVASGVPYVAYNIFVQKMDMYYGSKWVDWGYQILLCLSNNFLGFGLAGIMRKFCVYPVRALWPTILPTLALNKALMIPEKSETINGWKMSRYYFFFLFFGLSFVYFWIPNYLADFLSLFNWLAWIDPNNQRLADITGAKKGLGLNPIPSFDWNIVGTSGMILPFYSTINSYIGNIIAFFTICGVYYTNQYWTGFIPLNTNSLFSNTGHRYKIREVVNDRSLFDKEKYEKYGPPFYSAADLVSYGAFFAIYPFSIVYECFVNYRGIGAAFKQLGKGFTMKSSSTYEGFDDPHSRMMRNYKEVPEWCFTVILVLSIVLAIICVKIYPAETPVWTIFFALAINFVFLIPITAIYATTGFSFGLNVLVELIIGYALPGNGLALNFVKAFGYNIDAQAENYINSHKMSHYNKIPPRALFRVQMLSVLVSSFVCLAVINWQMDTFVDYCSPNNINKFTCPGLTTFYSASIIWGVIGPKRVFDGLYPQLKYCFLIGFLLALLFIAIKTLVPSKRLKYFQPTLIIGGFLDTFPPYNLSYRTGGVYVGLAFMVYLRKRYMSWWEKYNYVLAAAIPAGIAFSSIIIFFSVEYHPKPISWWGNNVNYQGYDHAGLARLNATEQAPDGYYGPRIGNFP